MAVGEVQRQPAAIWNDKAKNILTIALDNTSIVEYERMMELSAYGTKQFFLSREEFQNGHPFGSFVDPLSGKRLWLSPRRGAGQRAADGKGEHHEQGHATIHVINLLFATQRFLSSIS